MCSFLFQSYCLAIQKMRSDKFLNFVRKNRCRFTYLQQRNVYLQVRIELIDCICFVILISRLAPNTLSSPTSTYEFYAFHGAGIHRIKLPYVALFSNSILSKVSWYIFIFLDRFYSLDRIRWNSKKSLFRHHRWRGCWIHSVWATLRRLVLWCLRPSHSSQHRVGRTSWLETSMGYDGVFVFVCVCVLFCLCLCLCFIVFVLFCFVLFGCWFCLVFRTDIYSLALPLRLWWFLNEFFQATFRCEWRSDSGTNYLTEIKSPIPEVWWYLFHCRNLFWSLASQKLVICGLKKNHKLCFISSIKQKRGQRINSFCYIKYDYSLRFYSDLN
jgi:hypothetical protein